MRKSKRARQAERQAALRRSRRIRILVVAAAVVGTAAVIAGGLLIARALRLGRVVVVSAMSESEGVGDGGLADLMTQVVNEVGGLAVDSRVLTLRLVDEARRPDDADAVLGLPAPAGREIKQRLVAVDPYVLAVDSRSGLVVDSTVSITELTAALGAVDSQSYLPLVVAGDNPWDRAAFLLYLAGEFLAPEDFSRLLGFASPDPEVGQESGPVGAPEGTDPAVALMQPVLRWIGDRRNAGILAGNWTNWDRIALRDAIRAGAAAAYFLPRSVLEGLSFDERFHLRPVRPPAGAGRLRYSLLGRALSLEPGSGPRADASQALLALLRSGPVQGRIETETSFSPVALDGDPVNLEHRNLVRWFTGAASYLPLTEELVSAPVFRELRRLLR